MSSRQGVVAPVSGAFVAVVAAFAWAQAPADQLQLTGPGPVTALASGVSSVPPLSGTREAPAPSWGKPLPYPIVIADRRNNRLIEVAPDKRIVWAFDSPDRKVYRGNEDVNFAADGKTLWVSEEDNYDIHGVDYEKRLLFWT